jgi:hypothetical protein
MNIVAIALWFSLVEQGPLRVVGATGMTSRRVRLNRYECSTRESGIDSEFPSETALSKSLTLEKYVAGRRM